MDHAFIGCRSGAPEGEALLRLRAHPGDAPPIRRIRAVSAGLRGRNALSRASRSAQEHGLVSYFEAPQPLLEILFEGPAGMRIDVRPDLPLVFRTD